jgi:hypothetical protein
MQTLTKKNLNYICLKPKKLYKLYNAKKIKLKEHKIKFRNQNLKLLNYKHLLTEKKKKKEKSEFKKQSNKFHKKSKEKICFLPLCDLSKLIFSILFEKK